MFAAEQPDRFVAEMSKAKRKGRIFIDWLRNERGATAIAPLSVRARPDAPVAAPITWEELPDIDKASAIGMDEALKRYAKGYPSVPVQGLTKAVIEALAKAAGS